MGRVYLRDVAEISNSPFPDIEHPNRAVHVDLWVFRLRSVVNLAGVLNAVTHYFNSHPICKPRKLSD